MSSPDVSIIVINWHSRDYVRACALSVREHTQCSYELIVVDNASNDGCLEMLAREFPDTVCVQSSHNAGFAAANNLGLRHAVGEFVLFLNPDTVVLGSAIDRMVDALRRHTTIGPLGARLLNSDCSLQTSCVQALPTIVNQLLGADLLLRTFPQWPLWQMDALVSPAPDVVAVEAVSGACLMMRADRCHALGGFSEAFFMYGEDMDLCSRARAAGWLAGHLSTAVVIHHGGGSSRRQPSTAAVRMMRDAIETYFLRNHGPATARRYRVSTQLAAMVRLVLLGLGAPGWFAVGRGAAWRDATDKWITILRWSRGALLPE